MVWVVALGGLLNFGLTVWGLMTSGSRGNATKLREHDKVLGDQSQRIAALEQTQKTLPTKDDMHGISLGLEGMKGEMKAMRAEMEGSREIMVRLEAIVGRHENHLLDGR